MSSLIWHVTMSLDGFIAGPNDSVSWAVAQWSEVELQRNLVATSGQVTDLRFVVRRSG